MKKFASKLLTMALVLAMIVPQTAMAAKLSTGATCSLTVSIQDDRENLKVASTTDPYNTAATPLAAEVVSLIVQDKNAEGKYERLSVFASPAMLAIMEEGVLAFTSDADWAAYLGKYAGQVNNVGALDLKTLIQNKSVTLGEMEVGVPYQMSFKNTVAGDAKEGVTYTVTVTLNEIRDDDSDGPSGNPVIKPEEKPEEKPAAGYPRDPAATGVADWLNTKEHIAFMSGDSAGTFRPDDSVTRAEVAQIFYNLLKDQDVEITASFSDVPDGIWYAKAVNTLASLGIVSGVGEGKYEPARPITRAEFATIATKFAAKASSLTDFDDVPKSHWAYQFVSTAAAYGWISGVGENKFAPDQAIKRVEAATIVNKMLYRLGDAERIDAGEGRQFPDVTKAHWGYYQVAEATTEHDYEFNADRTQENWIK